MRCGGASHDASNELPHAIAWFLLVTSLGIVGAGCGSDSDIDRVLVSGKVTYTSQPMADGMIRFVPAKGSRLPISGGSITEGEYKITMRGGVPVGSHRVEIRSFRELPKPYPDMPDVMVPKEQLLPKKFNKQSELQREIEPDRSMTPDFALSD